MRPNSKVNAAMELPPCSCRHRVAAMEPPGVNALKHIAMGPTIEITLIISDFQLSLSSLKKYQVMLGIFVLQHTNAFLMVFQKIS